MATPVQTKPLTTSKDVVTGLVASKVQVQDIVFMDNFYRVIYTQGISVDVPYTAASRAALATLENEAFIVADALPASKP